MKFGEFWTTRDGRTARIDCVAGKGAWPVTAEIGGGKHRFTRSGAWSIFAIKDPIDLVRPAPERVYIAGPMTGLPDLNRPAFHAAAAQYRARGAFVFNPAEVELHEGAEWADYMRAEIPHLVTCDTIVLLPGHDASAGANLELHIARQLGMSIVWPE